MTNPILAVEGLTVRGHRNGSPQVILDDISLKVSVGEIAGLVGESGSGKSMLGSAIGGLQPINCKITAGRILWRDRDLRGADETVLSALRGSQIAYIFQEPMTALNPTLSIGRQMVDVIRRHTDPDEGSARGKALKLLADVRIDSPEDVFNAWPHQLSGGMRQRVLIAMAFSCAPALIVADEPTTALDVTVQAQVLTLLLRLARDRRTAVLLISHDIGVIRRTCETVHVMYAGRVVERGNTAAVLAAPRHPYTRALLDCLPGRVQPKTRLNALSTSQQTMPGCSFRARCQSAFNQCSEVPPMADVLSVGAAACWLTQQNPLAGDLS
jgi:peptide/nickel transport system ATP-binding protein